MIPLKIDGRTIEIDNAEAQQAILQLLRSRQPDEMEIILDLSLRELLTVAYMLCKENENVYQPQKNCLN